MELQDLDHDERLALVALLEIVIDADAEVSDAELEILDEISEEIGEELYEDTADEVDRRFQDEEALRAFLPSITRQEAREVIFGTVLDAALVDAVNGAEGDLLTWLAKAWNVSVETEDPEAES